MSDKTHVVLPVEVYERIASFLVQQPYAKVADLVQDIQTNVRVTTVTDSESSEDSKELDSVEGE